MHKHTSNIHTHTHTKNRRLKTNSHHQRSNLIENQICLFHSYYPVIFALTHITSISLPYEYLPLGEISFYSVVDIAFILSSHSQCFADVIDEISTDYP